MSQETTIANTEVSFKDFLFKNKRNRTILWLAAAAIVIQFAVFKYFYPFASYIHGDSFSYIKAALENLSINTYLIGYSKFLRLISVFATSDFVLFLFQYILIQLSVLFLLFTIFYLYSPSKWARTILLTFMICNPLFLHLANLVSSDGVFLALSMIWFTLLIWIIHKPSNKIIIWHAVILFLSFTVRYNAMIYPFISAGVFWISKLSVRNKIIGFSFSALLCTSFVVFTSHQYYKLTGYWQYSPFSGWQLTNNAMYAYRYVNASDRKPVPKKFQTLDRMIREYFDSTRDYTKHPQEALLASSVYMWTKRFSLYVYRDTLFKNDTKASEFKKWASMGPFYNDYGLFIIKQYPKEYARYFLWPNANKYYAPPLEFLEVYNSFKDTVTNIAKYWFNYDSQKVKTRMKNKAVWILVFYPFLSGIINAVMLCILIFYLTLKGWNYNMAFSKGVLLGSTFWLCNAGFTIIASSAALRFQAFPIMIVTIYVALLIDWMIMQLNKVNLETNNSIGKKNEGYLTV